MSVLRTSLRQSQASDFPDSASDRTSPVTSLRPNRNSRRSLAALAREKTSTYLASIGTNPSLRSTPSSSSIRRNEASLLDNQADIARSSIQVDRNPQIPSPSELTTDPFHNGNMHQTSSRLLRMTDEERPFTRDFKDLFSTLMVSLPLTPHRIGFRRVEHSFTSEEAINNLGSLKFSQSNRMPDPKDPSRIVTTTTTTTFSMAKEMAKSVCQRFLDARFIEAADGKLVREFTLKGAVWQMTPKGVHVLHRFCQRNGINSDHVEPILRKDNMHLVILERDLQTDKLDQDRATIEVIFRRFAGEDGPNVKSSIATSDSDSLNDYSTGLVGVKMAKERRILDRVVQNTFTGKAATDWLMDCCTTIDRRETYLMCEMFIKNGLMWVVVEDKVFIHQNPTATVFQPTKNAVYALTDRGQRICGWIGRDKNVSAEEKERRPDQRNGPRDSNNNRLTSILQDPALRLLFREFLRNSLCEENLSFYQDVKEFTTTYHNQEKTKAFLKVDTVRETLASAYGLYNAFLAPGSPCELNIDHSLRNSLASRMTRAVGPEDSMLKSLREVVELFEVAQNSVFKLMSSDSVPKFMRDQRYQNILREHNFDTNVNGRAYSPTPAVPERSISRSARG